MPSVVSSDSYRIRSTRLRMGLLLMLLIGALTPVASQTVVSTHPRIWLTPARLARLKDYASRNNGAGTKRWQILQGIANNLRSLVQQNDATTLSDSENMPPLAMAYQVTGDKTYAQAAITILMGLATSANDLSNDSMYDYRYLPDYIAAYDWCFDQMTASQRTQVAKWLMDRADAVWPETNGGNDHWADTDPADNYFYGFLMTWPAALAVTNEEPRAAKHLALALSKFNTLVKPWASSWGVGGMFAEGTNYDSTHYLAQILDAHLTATGQDFINDPSFPYLHQSVLWRVFATTPDKGYDYWLGDHSQHLTTQGQLFDYDRWRALFFLPDLSDATLAGYAKSWLDTISPSICSHAYTVTWEFLDYPEDGASVDYTQSLPLGYYASGPGVYLRRSSWATDATYWGIWAGSAGESHQCWDNNGFLIYKGGPLVGNGSMWSEDGIYQDTSYHNNLTFGGQGQQQQYSYPDGGQMVKEESGLDWGYFAGDATAVYNGPYVTPFVNQYVRKMVQAGDNLFVVYDRANLMNAATSKEWHLHSKKPVSINGRTFQLDNGSYRVWGQSLLPAGGVTLSTDGIQGDYDPGVTSYEVQVVAKTGQKLDYLLNVLQVAPVSQSSVSSPQVLPIASGGMDGVLCGNWVVVLGRSELVSGVVNYSLNTTLTTKHLALDLEPNEVYQVGVTDKATNLTTNTTQISSDIGSLRFAVPAGNHAITLTPKLAITVTSFALVPTAVPSNASSQGTITLSGITGSTGATVTLSSSNPSAASVPNSIVVASGTNAVNVQVNTLPVFAPTQVTISATLNGVTRSATLTIVPNFLQPHPGPVPSPGPVRPTPAPHHPPTPPVPSGTFVKGMSLGGDAVTIEGNQWLSYSDALASGLTVTNAEVGETSPVTLNPPTDSNTADMLSMGLWTSGSSFTLTYPLRNGRYQVYVWEVEDDSDHARSFNLLLQGSVVASGIGNQLLGQWHKYGPYPASVSNGVLTLNAAEVFGNPQLMGLAIYTQ